MKSQNINKMADTKKVKIETIDGKTIEELEMEMYPEEMQQKMQKIKTEYEAFDKHNFMLREKFNKEREEIEENYFNKCKAREEANALAKKQDDDEYQKAISVVDATLKVIKNRRREGAEDEHIENYRGPLIVNDDDTTVSNRRKHTLKEKIALVLKNKAGFRKDLSKAVGFNVDNETWGVCYEFALRLLQNVNVIIYENKAVEYLNASPDSDWHIGKWPTIKDPKDKESTVTLPKKMISKQELVKTLVAVVIGHDLIQPSAPNGTQIEEAELADMDIRQEDQEE
jgi:hypothetical protein